MNMSIFLPAFSKVQRKGRNPVKDSGPDRRATPIASVGLRGLAYFASGLGRNWNLATFAFWPLPPIVVGSPSMCHTA